MDLIVVTLQFALAVVLAVAAVGKLLDLPGSRAAVAGFGVAERYANPLGTALPIVELALAALLLSGPTTQWAAIAAALLFLAFIAGIGWNLTKGRQPECHCFGQFHSAPAGWPTIIRNAGFTLMALVIAIHGGRGPADWFRDLTELGQIVVVFGLLLVALAALQTWFLWRIWARGATPAAASGNAMPILADDTAAPEGAFEPAPAPGFDLPTLDGGRMTLSGLLESGNPALLLFVDPGCGPCRHLVPDIHEWHRRFSGELTIALISRGTIEDNREKFGDLAVALQDEWEVYTEYDVMGTPSGVVVSADGMMREAPAPGRGNIRQLVVRTMQGTAAPAREPAPAPSSNGDEDDPTQFLRIPTGPEVGTRGTRLPLPDLDGGYIGLDDLRGSPAIVLFWSPTCAFCQRMLPELKEWEEEAGDALRSLLVVSDGTPEANREQGLRSRIVLDDAFVTGEAYGITGTPSVIRLDAGGRVASGIVAGADNVLDLLYEQIDQPATT